jgi:hypothetical protein
MVFGDAERGIQTSDPKLWFTKDAFNVAPSLGFIVLPNSKLHHSNHMSSIINLEAFSISMSTLLSASSYVPTTSRLQRVTLCSSI